MNVNDYEIQKIVGSNEYTRDEKIHELLKRGLSYSQIASQIHVGYSTISNVVKNTQFQFQNNSSNRSATTTTTRSKPKVRHYSRGNVQELLTKEDMAQLWSIYNTINRRRAMSNPRLDSFFNILKKIEKKSNF